MLRWLICQAVSLAVDYSRIDRVEGRAREWCTQDLLCALV